MERSERGKKYQKIEQDCSELVDKEKIFALIRDGLDIARKYDDQDYVLFFEAEKAHYEKNYSKAQKLLERAIQLNNNSLFLRCLGIQLSLLGQKEEAIKQFDQAIKVNTDDYHSYRGKGVALSKLGQKEAAIKEFDQALKLNPDDDASYLQKGVSLSKLGQKEAAIKEFDQALKFNPDDYASYRQKGVSLSKLGQEEAALKAFDQALKLNPDDYASYRQKGVTLSKLGQEEDALKAFDHALKINPDDFDSYQQKGVLLSKLGQEEAAIIEFDHALKLNPDDFDSYQQKGVVFSDLGQEEKAIKLYIKALDLKKEDNYTKGLLGNSYRILQQYEKAEPLLKESLKQNEYKNYFFSFYAETLYRQKKYDRAKEVIEEGLQDFPDDERIQYVKALIDQDPAVIDFFDKQEKRIKEYKAKQREYQKQMKLSERFSERMIHKVGNSAFLLNGIVQNLELAGLDSFNNDTLKSLKNVVYNIQSVIRELKEIKAPLSKYKIKTNITDSIQTLTTGLKQEFAAIEISTSNDVPEILLHKTHFQQVIGEILHNAAKLNQDKLKLIITIDVTDAPPSASHLKGNQFIRIKIADDGRGVPFDKKDSIFEPFVSLSNGTGLGLAIVKKIVEEEHEGYISETGKYADGACFELYLPY